MTSHVLKMCTIKCILNAILLEHNKSLKHNMYFHCFSVYPYEINVQVETLAGNKQRWVKFHLY